MSEHEQTHPPPLTLPMRMSDEINEIAAALSACQGELHNPTANVQSGASYKYAGLDQILDVVRPLRKKYGLSMFQTPEIHGDKTILASMLMHKSGQYLTGLIEITGEDTRGKSSDQAMGSSISYMRKYCELAAMGLFPQGEDKDGSSSAAPAAAVQQVPTMAAVLERTVQKFVEKFGDPATAYLLAQVTEQGLDADEQFKDMAPTSQAGLYISIIEQGQLWNSIGPPTTEAAEQMELNGNGETKEVSA
jgi:hypothetical protein